MHRKTKVSAPGKRQDRGQHHLSEDDRHDRQEAERQRADEEVARQPALGEKHRGNRSQAKRLLHILDREAALDEDQFAAPIRLEGGAVHDQRRRAGGGGRVLQHEARRGRIALEAEQHSMASAGEPHDRRQRTPQLRQGRPFRRQRTATEARPFRAGDQLRRRDRRRGQGIVLEDPLDGEVHAVAPPDDHEAVEGRWMPLQCRRLAGPKRRRPSARLFPIRSAQIQFDIQCAAKAGKSTLPARIEEHPLLAASLVKFRSHPQTTLRIELQHCLTAPL